MSEIPNGDSKISKLLFGEISRIAAILIFLAPVVIFIFGIKQDIAVIKVQLDVVSQILKDEQVTSIENQKDIVTLHEQVLILQQKIK